MRAQACAAGGMGGASPVTDLERLGRAGFEAAPGGYPAAGRWSDRSKKHPAWRRGGLLIVKAAPGDWRLIVDATKRQRCFANCASAINIANRLQGVG